MLYFAYGSNISISRLTERVPSAVSLGCHSLKEHDLRFHKVSLDGSGKCDAYFTSNAADIIYGVLFKIDPTEKPALDKIEGLGYGYEVKEVTVSTMDGWLIQATTYVAIKIDQTLKPYSWYKNHFLIGAREALLPVDYIQTKMQTVETIEDKDRERDATQRAIHKKISGVRVKLSGS